MKTNREKFFAKHGITADSLSLQEIASYSGFPVAALREVEKRGFGAYTTNPQSVRMKGTFKKGVNAPMSQKLSPQQWARARVFAFVMKTSKVFYGADKDIAEKYRLL